MISLLPALLTILFLSGPAIETAGPTPSRPALRGARDPLALLTAPDRRLRAVDRKVQRVVEEGLRRSSTFTSLLTELDQTDVIVYVERVRDLPAVIAGRLVLVPGGHGQRYLRIQLGTGGSMEDAIATLAHELQHALEIAAFPDVRDEPTLVQLYRRIGHAGVGEHTYDTVEAQDAGRRVKRELQG